jgi:CBS domain-containing protein
MNVTIAEIMRAPVLTVGEADALEVAVGLMRSHRVSALPVVGPNGPVGMVTATDCLEPREAGALVGSFMSSPPLTVPSTEGPHVAARIMRNHKVHHVMVVDHHTVVGMVSAYDLLQLVEDHRFQVKQAPTPPSRKTSKRR